MKISIAKDKNLEKHGLFVKIVRFFSVPILNSLPSSFLQNFMKKSSDDAGIVADNPKSPLALEVMYTRYDRNLFSKGFIRGLGNLFWQHFTSHPKSLRNRLKIVEHILEKEILNIINQNQKKEIKILTIGGGSARGIVEILKKHSIELREWQVSVTNVDKSLKSIEIGKELARKFGLYDKFEWINDLAQNIKFLISKNSVDIVEMVGLLDYFRDEKAKEVFRQVYDMLKENGLFIVGNIILNKEQPFISKVGWTNMYYRQDFDVIRLLTESGFLEERGEVIFEPLMNHIVVVIKK